MLQLTENAQKVLAQVIAGAENPVAGLRVEVSSGGCSGFQYALSLEEEAPEGDQIVQAGDLNVFVPPASAEMLSGVTIDFTESVEGAGFVFENPNAKSACGCGKSFCA